MVEVLHLHLLDLLTHTHTRRIYSLGGYYCTNYCHMSVKHCHTKEIAKSIKVSNLSLQELCSPCRPHRSDKLPHVSQVQNIWNFSFHISSIQCMCKGRRASCSTILVVGHIAHWHIYLVNMGHLCSISHP